MIDILKNYVTKFSLKDPKQFHNLLHLGSSTWLTPLANAADSAADIAKSAATGLGTAVSTLGWMFTTLIIPQAAQLPSVQKEVEAQKEKEKEEKTEDQEGPTPGFGDDMSTLKNCALFNEAIHAYYDDRGLNWDNPNKRSPLNSAKIRGGEGYKKLYELAHAYKEGRQGVGQSFAKAIFCLALLHNFLTLYPSIGRRKFHELDKKSIALTVLEELRDLYQAHFKNTEAFRYLNERFQAAEEAEQQRNRPIGALPIVRMDDIRLTCREKEEEEEEEDEQEEKPSSPSTADQDTATTTAAAEEKTEPHEQKEVPPAKIKQGEDDSITLENFLKEMSDVGKKQSLQKKKENQLFYFKTHINLLSLDDKKNLLNQMKAAQEADPDETEQDDQEGSLLHHFKVMRTEQSFIHKAFHATGNTHTWQSAVHAAKQAYLIDLKKQRGSTTLRAKEYDDSQTLVGFHAARHFNFTFFRSTSDLFSRKTDSQDTFERTFTRSPS
jgi:hypothetical protein